MPQPNLNSSTMEWMFTEQEALQAKVLPELTVLWLRTKYARMLAQQILMGPPKEVELDRGYLMERAELSGKLALITEIIQEHAEAVNFVSANPEVLQSFQVSEVQNLESRAAINVHNSGSSL